MCQVFSLFSPFLSYRHLQVVLDGTSLQKYPDNDGLSAASILDLAFFLFYINDLPDVICNITIYADDTTLYTQCDQNGASDLGQQLELASKLEYDQQDPVVG